MYYVTYPVVLNNSFIYVSMHLILSARAHKNSRFYSRQLTWAKVMFPAPYRIRKTETKIIPFGVRIGVLHVIRHTHLLDFFDNAINLAISALVAFRH